MDVINFLINVAICAVLFFILSPGILFTLPIQGTKYMLTGAHAILFGIASYALFLVLNYQRDDFKVLSSVCEPECAGGTSCVDGRCRTLSQ